MEVEIITSCDDGEMISILKNLVGNLALKNMQLRSQIAAMQRHELEKVLPANVIQLWDADFLVKYAIGYFDESLPFLGIDEDSIRRFIEIKRRKNDDKD